MNHNRRKILTEQENEIPEYDSITDIFGSVQACKSGDIFEILIPNPKPIQDDGSDAFVVLPARLPAKFKHVIWAKTGDLVIIRPEEIVNRSQWIIHAILSPAHIKYFAQQQLLPLALTSEKLQGKCFTNQVIQQVSVDQRFLSHDFENEDDELPEINNRRARPFADSSDDDE